MQTRRRTAPALFHAPAPADERGMLPHARRATPMYVACSDITSECGYAASVASSALSAGGPRWVLKELPTMGGEGLGLLVDAATRLVYWQQPAGAGPASGPATASSRSAAPSHAVTAPDSLRPATACNTACSAGGYSNELLDGATSQHSAEEPSPRGKTSQRRASSGGSEPLLPVLVGRLRGRLEDSSAARDAVVVPLSLDDVVTVERCRNALRSLWCSNPAAQLLMRAAWHAFEAPGEGADSLLAELSPELRTAPYCQAVSLAVPLCCVLGVSQVNELQHLTAQDLRACAVDETFLPAILKLGRAQEGGRQVHTRAGTGSMDQQRRPQSQSMARRSLVLHAQEQMGKWLPPALQELLMQHHMLKLMPLAAHMGLFHPGAVRRWQELCPTATNRLQLHSPELRRLEDFRKAISAVDQKRIIMKAHRSLKLARVGVGSLVLYEAQSQRAQVSGGQLVGVVISTATGASGEIVLAVRDLLDDSLTTITPGQVSHVSWTEASKYLRADLLPPPSLGAPVTPMSAAPGLLVQLVGSWRAGEPAADGRGDPALQSRLVIGKLVRPDHHSMLEDGSESASGLAEDEQQALGQSWIVQWPDGSECSHAVGRGGQFALAHLHMHRQQGAPVLAEHLEHVQLSVPVVRSPVWPYQTTDDVVPGAVGMAQLDSTQGKARVLWSRARGTAPRGNEYSAYEQAAWLKGHVSGMDESLQTTPESKQVAADTSKLREVEEALKRLQQEFDEQATELRAAQTQVDRQRKMLEKAVSLNKQLQHRAEQVADIHKQEQERRQRQQHQQHQEQQQQHQQWVQQQKKQDAELSAVRQALQEAKQQLATLQGQTAQATEQHAAALKQLEASQAENARLAAELQALQDGAATEAMAELQRLEQALQAAYADAEQAVANTQRMQTELAAAELKVETATAEVRMLKAELQGLGQALHEAQASAEQAVADTQQGQTELATAKSKVEAATVEVQMLKVEVQGLGQALQEAQAHAEQAVAETLQVQNKLEVASLSSQATVAKMQRLQAELGDARQQTAAGRAEVQHVQSELRVAQAAVVEVQTLQAELADARRQTAVATAEVQLALSTERAQHAHAQSELRVTKAAVVEVQRLQAEAVMAATEMQHAQSELLVAKAAVVEVQRLQAEAVVVAAEMQHVHRELRVAKSAVVEVSRLQVEAGVAVAAMQQAQSQLQAAKAEVAEMHQLQAELKAVQKQAVAAAAEIQQAQSQLQAAKAVVAEMHKLQAELGIAQNQAAAAAAEARLAQSNLQAAKAAEAEVHKLQAELKAAQHQAAAAAAAAQQAWKELQTAKAAETATGATAVTAAAPQADGTGPEAEASKAQAHLLAEIAQLSKKLENTKKKLSALDKKKTAEHMVAVKALKAQIAALQSDVREMDALRTQLTDREREVAEARKALTKLRYRYALESRVMVLKPQTRAEREEAERVLVAKETELAVSRVCLPLCHGLLAGQPVTCFTAKPGVLVEPSDCAAGEGLTHVAAAGPGTLTLPVGLAPGQVVWEVRWAGGAVTECALGGVDCPSPLKVSAYQMQLPGAGAVPLNEVGSGTGAPLGQAVHRAVTTAAATTLKRFVDTQGAVKHEGQLGRPLFLRPIPLAPRDGMLGIFVKLNREGALLQPYCEAGPLHAHTPRSPAEVCVAQAEGGPPVDLDDVGWVVRDAGAGQWRGLLVRVLGGSQAAWYDEAVLLPASQMDVQRQVARRGQKSSSYVLPINQPGVPVTDANAAHGMLVKRAYTPASPGVHEGHDRASMVGELVESAGEHMWLVAWRDGSRGRYRTGARGRFQLCHVNLHDDAGAPLRAETVTELLAGGVSELAVTDGVHCCVDMAKGSGKVHVISLQGMSTDADKTVSGEVGFGDSLGQDVRRLLSQGVIHDPDLGGPFLCGGPLALYELCHATRPRDPVTVFNAKPGLRVQRASEMDSATPKVGLLVRPVRLGLEARLQETDATGEPVEWLNAAECWWDISWEDGHVTQMPVGTLAQHTALRVALGGGIRSAASVSRAVTSLERVMRHLARDCEALIKGQGDMPLQDRLVAVVVQVQLQSTEEEYKEVSSGDAVPDDEADVQPYAYDKYLQIVDAFQRSVERLHVAKQAVLLTRDTLRGGWPAGQEEGNRRLEALGERAGDLLGSRLPAAVDAILKASLAVANSSCQRVLEPAGNVTQLEWDWPVAEEVDDDAQAVKECIGQVAETAIALDICTTKLLEMQEIIPADSYYYDALEDMVTRARGQVALACSATASEWATAACIPLLRVLREPDTAEQLTRRSQLLSTAVEQLLAAVGMSLRVRAHTESESTITPQADAVELRRGDEFMAQWHTGQEEDQASQEPTTDKHLSAQDSAGAVSNANSPARASVASDKVQMEMSSDASAADIAKMNGQLEPVAIESKAPVTEPIAPKTTMAAPDIELSLQTTVAMAVDMLHQASKAVAQQLSSIPTARTQQAGSTMEELQDGLASLRIADVLSSQAQSVEPILEAALPDRKVREQAAASLQLITRAAEAARADIASRAKAIAAQQVAAGCAAATLDSVMCVALACMASREASGALAGQWATKAASYWPKVVEDLERAVGVLVCTEAAALAKAQAQVEAAQEAMAGAKGESTAALRAEVAQADANKKEAQAVRVREEQALRRWFAATAHTVCYALASDWAFKGLDEITSVYDLSPKEAIDYYAAEEARRASGAIGTRPCPDPATGQAPTFPELLYLGDRSMVAIHGLLAPLRLSSQMVGAAAKHSLRAKLEEAYNDVFQAAAGVVYERNERFAKDLEIVQEDLQQMLERPDATGDDDELPAMLVAQAYGLAYISRATHTLVASLLKQVPQVLPKQDGVLDKLRDGDMDANKLLEAAKGMESMFAQHKSQEAFASYTASAVQSIVAVTARRQHLGHGSDSNADNLSAAKLRSMQMCITQDKQTGRLTVTPGAAGLSQGMQSKVKEALKSAAVEQLLAPLQGMGDQLCQARKQLAEAAGTSWNKDMLRLQRSMQENETKWYAHVAAAASKLPPLVLW